MIAIKFLTHGSADEAVGGVIIGIEVCVRDILMCGNNYLVWLLEIAADDDAR